MDHDPMYNIVCKKRLILDFLSLLYFNIDNDQIKMSKFDLTES